VDVAALRSFLECANCSLHATVLGALSETVATVSLSTVPVPAVLSFANGEADVQGGGQALSLTDLAVHLCSDQMKLWKCGTVFRKQNNH